MKRYKLKASDVVNDIWILQERIFLIFWKSLGAGSQEKVIQKIKELEDARNESVTNLL